MSKLKREIFIFRRLLCVGCDKLLSLWRKSKPSDIINEKYSNIGCFYKI